MGISVLSDSFRISVGHSHDFPSWKTSAHWIGRQNSLAGRTSSRSARHGSHLSRPFLVNFRSFSIICFCIQNTGNVNVSSSRPTFTFTVRRSRHCQKAIQNVKQLLFSHWLHHVMKRLNIKGLLLQPPYWCSRTRSAPGCLEISFSPSPYRSSHS